MDAINLNQIQTEVNQALLDNETDDIRDLKKRLTALVASGALDSLGRASVNAWLAELDFARNIAISDSRFLDLVEHNLLQAAAIPDFDLLQAFANRFLLIDFPSDQVDFLENLIKALKKNEEVIGQGNLKIDNGIIPASVRNWITAYDNTPSKNAQRNQLDILTCIKNHSEVKLSESEKQILIEILRVYDGARNWLAEYKDVANPQEVPDDVALEVLFGLRDEGQQASQASPPIQPSAPVPTPSANLPVADKPEPKPEPAISSPQKRPELDSKLAAAMQANLKRVAPTEVASNASVNIQDEKQRLLEENINKRLEELKKRVS